MRHPRIRFELGQDGFVHVYNRTVGSSSDLLFGEAEKHELLRRLDELNGYYSVEVLAAVAMGNHFHAIVYVPAEPLSAEEAAARYRRRYPRKRPLRTDSKACQKLALKLRDISAFMKDFQQPMARWYNRTRARRRRGHLWAERFKSTVLESGLAVWDCWKYIEMNPVRAGLAETPADYRFCSFGRWCGTGCHPYEAAFRAHLLPSLKGLLHADGLEDVHTELRKEFARIKAVDQRSSEQDIGAAIATAAEKEPFVTRADRRMRYWVDGLAIGSHAFVMETMARARGAAALKKRRLTAARTPEGAASPLCCFKQLRVLLE